MIFRLYGEDKLQANSVVCHWNIHCIRLAVSRLFRRLMILDLRIENFYFQKLNDQGDGRPCGRPELICEMD